MGGSTLIVNFWIFIFLGQGSKTFFSSKFASLLLLSSSYSSSLLNAELISTYLLLLASNETSFKLIFPIFLFSLLPFFNFSVANLSFSINCFSLLSSSKVSESLNFDGFLNFCLKAASSRLYFFEKSLKVSELLDDLIG